MTPRPSGPLSKPRYSRLQEARREQEWIDLQAAGMSSGMILTHLNQQPVPLRQMMRQQTRIACDAVIIPDHHEIALETSDYRTADVVFRETVATEMANYYRAVVGADKMIELCGSRLQRSHALQQRLRDVIRRHL